MQTLLLPHDAWGPAVPALARGDLVAFPTETVYGLGADGWSAEACQKIFQAKGRPADNPLILHVTDVAGLEALCQGPLPRSAEILTQALWPGPLTVVVSARNTVPMVVRGGLDTVAVRCPDHALATALIRDVGRPLAAPSANRSGYPSPTTADAVWADMAGRIPYIIDGGETAIGLESTVVDCTTDPVTLLRPGAIGRGKLEALLGRVADAPPAGPTRSPGMKYRHYAPDAPVIWVRTESRDALAHYLEGLRSQYPKQALLAPGELLVGQTTPTWRESLGANAMTAAHNLFKCLRELDRGAPDVIVVVWHRDDDLGLAVMNRVEKASVAEVRL